MTASVHERGPLIPEWITEYRQGESDVIFKFSSSAETMGEHITLYRQCCVSRDVVCIGTRMLRNRAGQLCY